MKKFHILYVSLASMLIMFFVIVGFGLQNTTLNNIKVGAVDDSYTITINKTSAFSVFVTGSGVLKASTNASTDVYTVEQGTQINLRVVNETKIFNGWDITGTYEIPSGYTCTTASEVFTIVPQSNLTVGVSRIDPTTSDKGKYMSNRFLIASYQDLFALQEAFKAGTTGSNALYQTKLFTKNEADYSLINFYDQMFEGDPTWMSYGDNVAAKINGIKNAGFFARIQKGYYLVTQSFAYFDISESMIIEGVGTTTNPFMGVFDGLNGNDISSIFVVTSINQETTNNITRYIGLFGVLDEQAIIKNLKLDVSIAINKADANPQTQNYYIGGIAGRCNSAFIYNIECSARHSVELSGATTKGNKNSLYIGGLFGYMEAGIEDYANISLKQSNYSWNIETYSSFDNVYSGLIAGIAENSYVNRISVNVGGFNYNVHSNKQTTSDDIQYHAIMSSGNIFGKYVTKAEKLNRKLYVRNLDISGSNSEVLSIILHTGTAYTGGLIGYIDASVADRYLYIGDVVYNIDGSGTSSILSSSINKDSITNLYAGGLFGYINGGYVKADSSFKDRIVTQYIEDQPFKRYNYIFNSNIAIKAENFGLTSAQQGKVFAGGLAAFGYFDISGTVDNPTELLLSPKNKTFTVNAIQKTAASPVTVNSEHIFDHCLAGLLFATVNSTENPNTPCGYSYNYINVYADNYGVDSIREIDSPTIGDLKSGGLLAYAHGISINGVHLYLNSGFINCSALSYASYTRIVGNNASCGGLVGNLWTSTVEDCLISGFDDDYNDVGTKLQILSIQNAQKGGTQDNANYVAENFVGGMFGEIRKTTLESCVYNGSPTNDDYIQLQGHQNPDTAFCGGIVGYIYNLTVSFNNVVNNCKIKNGHVYAGATNIKTKFNKPDIYVGGIVGASLCNSNGTTTVISNCNVNDTKIEAVGNELIRVYVGGIVGTINYSGITGTVTNCYVVNSQISAISKGQTAVDVYNNQGQNFARAAGIQSNTSSATISYCAVIDSTVEASASHISSIAAGIFTRERTQTATIKNCYTNAYVSSTGTAATIQTYPIAPCSAGTGADTSYYVKNNIPVITSEQNAVGITLNKTLLNTSSLDILNALSNNRINSNHNKATKFFPAFDAPDVFSVNDNGDNNVATLNQNGDTDATNYLYIIVSAKGSGNTRRPLFTSRGGTYQDLEELNADGWFILGTIIVYNGISSYAGSLSNPSISYPINYNEYEFKTDPVTGKTYFKNKIYPYDEIQNNDYENLGYNETAGGPGQILPAPSGVSSSVMYDLSDSATTFPSSTTTPSGRYIYLKTTANTYYYSFNQRGTQTWTDFEYCGSSTEGLTTYYYYRAVRPDFDSGGNTKAKIHRYYTVDRQLTHEWDGLEGNIEINIDKNDNDTLFLIETTRDSNGAENFTGIKTDITTNQLISNYLNSATINITGTDLYNGSTSNLEFYYSTDSSNWALIDSEYVDYSSSLISVDLSNYTSFLLSSQKYFQIINDSSDDDVSISTVNVTYEVEIIQEVNSYRYIPTGGSSSSGSFNIFNAGTETIVPSGSQGYYVDGSVFILPLLSSGVSVNRIITVNVRDDIPDIVIRFELDEADAILYESFVDIHGTPFTFNSIIGSYSFENSVNTVSAVREYVFTFKPNVEIEDTTTFYLAFTIGSTSNYAPYCYRFVINPNRRVLERVTYATYTPPLNYQKADKLGEASNPYMISYGSTTKLIPIFTRVNDLPYAVEEYHFVTQQALTRGAIGYTKFYELIDGEYVLTEDTLSNTSKTYYIFKRHEYLSEMNTSLVTYNLITAATGTMNASGEFVSVSSGSLNSDYYIDVVLNEDPTQKKSVYYNFAERFSVTYSSEGADIVGLANTTSKTPYIVDLTIQSGYCGSISRLLVTIGDTEYDLDDILSYPDGGWLRDSSGNEFNDEHLPELSQRFYRLAIPGEIIDGDIDIDVVFYQMFIITFDLQCVDFAYDYVANGGVQSLSYSVIKGTNFKEYFDSAKQTQINNLKEAVLDTLTGYIFTGWYLINNANNVISYTSSFEDILSAEQDIPINSSFVFYARWSFLIELVEAPGTHIHPAFNSDFMYQYDDNGRVTNTILIPLNNNNGYMFTVSKDDDFIGDVNVAAYSAKEINHEYVIEPIEIDYYNNNSEIYHIKKSNITGYVIITTSVSNSHIIVGRNTASILDEIVPQDGVFTFKYVVNHYNLDADSKSYIFSNNNLSKNMDLMFEFFINQYDSDADSFVQVPKGLIKDTTIEVFYSRFITSTETPDFTTVGTYKITAADEAANKYQFHLNDFKKWNYYEDYPESANYTFQDMIGSDNSVSEVYYIIVTPPNGYDDLPDGYELRDIPEQVTERDVWNCVMNVGYVEPDPENPGEYKYLEGERKTGNFNIHDLQENYSHVLQSTVSDETALQTAYYTVVPSRKTIVTNEHGTLGGSERDYYKFYDIQDYAFLDLTYHNCYINDDLGYIKLFDDAVQGTRGEIISSNFSSHLLEIDLVMGYNTGTVEVYGALGSSTDWELVSTIYVDDVDYKEYTVVFPERFNKFRIVNTSLNTIFLKEINYVSRLSGIKYEVTTDDYFNGDFFKVNKVPGSESGTLGADGYTVTYRSYQSIVGDVRHNGKTFALAVQIKDSSGIVMDIPYNYESIIECHVYYEYLDSLGTLQVGTTTIESNLANVKGRNTIFYNLTDVLREKEVNRISFYFTINDATYEINSILLVENPSFYKPAMAEVRQVVYDINA